MTIYDNKNIFNNIEGTNVYDAILIDEGQDFKPVWFRILEEKFLKPNGKFYVVADEGQDIYGHAEMDTDLKIVTGISGNWRKLPPKNSKNYRLTGSLYNLSCYYQKLFLGVNDEFQEQLNLETDVSCLSLNHDEIFKKLDELKGVKVEYEKSNYSFNDFVFLSSTVNSTESSIDMLEDSFGKKYITIKTTHSFLTLKERETINKKCSSISKRIEPEIDKLDRNKKMAFRMNSGCIKFSTIHSFKGWEAPVVFLLIDKNISQHNYHQIIYTGLTRAVDHLVICTNDERLTDFIKTLKRDNLI